LGANRAAHQNVFSPGWWHEPGLKILGYKYPIFFPGSSHRPRQHISLRRPKARRSFSTQGRCRPTPPCHRRHHAARPRLPRQNPTAVRARALPPRRPRRQPRRPCHPRRPCRHPDDPVVLPVLPVLPDEPRRPRRPCRYLQFVRVN
jgi:hypothetical protein